MTAPAMSFEEYDPNYPAAFARLAESIRNAIPQADIEHVGSTSVPGLGGRPVLDVVIPSAAADRETRAARAARSGSLTPRSAGSSPCSRGPSAMRAGPTGR
jgi:GrpB-like predicted nucleotidyltransferase (UPF0157 family)